MILALVAAAAQPAVAFAPPLDRPLLIRTEEERAVLGGVRRFVAERRLVFRQVGAQLIAEVTLVTLRTDAEGPVAQRFLTAAGGLKDRTLRFTLTASGDLAGVEDEAGAWTAMTGGFAKLTPSRAADAPAATAPFADLPPARRLALLAAPLPLLLAAGEAQALPGTRAVRLSAASTALTGSRGVRSEPGRRVLVTRAADPAGAVSIERTRTIDTGTGLLVSQEEVLRVMVNGDAQITRSSIRILTGI